MTFPAKPTTRDLSDIPENQAFPAYYSSQAGGNMVTEKNPHFGGRGSDTEAVHDVTAANMTDFGNEQHTPVLPGPEVENTDSEVNVDEKGSGYTPAARTWKELR
jgi:hypothetical protein